MNFNWEQKDKNVPRLEISGQSQNQNAKIKMFHPPAGCRLIAEYKMTEGGYPSIVVSWDRSPTAAQIGDVDPHKLENPQLQVVLAQQQDLDVKAEELRRMSDAELLDLLPDPDTELEIAD